MDGESAGSGSRCRIGDAGGGSAGSDSIAAAADSGGKHLDAGALFVLQSKGSWLHCGYHLTTSIVAPALLSLPFAMASLGWAGGILCLIVSAAVTFYSYNLLSLVLEHQADLGRRQLRFRDMADTILGPGWGRFYIGPVQFLVCYGCVVANILLGAQSLKSVYLIVKPDGNAELYEFVIGYGAFMLVLAQMPSFHSLRHLNLVSLILCLGYSASATAGAIYVGYSSAAPSHDYSILGTTQSDRVFGSFNAIAIIATTYGNGIIPEIQATIAPPVKGKMFKGLCLCYAVVLATFLSVAVSGYWAFGNQTAGTILSNFIVDERPIVPVWLFIVTNVFTVLQLAAVAEVYLQPTNDGLEGWFGDPNRGQYSARNVIPRLVFRSLSIVVATATAAALPFFADVNAVIGAFGFLPLDFVLPAVFYNVTFRPSKKGWLFWVNTAIAAVFAGFALLGSISAVRQVALDAKTYQLFADI